MLEDNRIAVIGCGNMGRSIIGGLIASDFPARQICGYDTDMEKRRQMEQQFAIDTSDNIRTAVAADVALMAVKPQQFRELMPVLRSGLGTRHPLFISVAAGIRLATLEAGLGSAQAIVRAMPNIAALVRASTTGVIANAAASDMDRKIAETILCALGNDCYWFSNDDEMDTVTAVSGSGPAYFFLVMEAMQQAAESMGMEPQRARLLVLSTARGATEFAMAGEEGLAQLGQRVSSPGGTTEQAIRVLQQGGLTELFATALEAARGRACELAQQQGQ